MYLWDIVLFDADNVPPLPQDFLDKGGKPSVQPKTGKRKKHPTGVPLQKGHVLTQNYKIIQHREFTLSLLHLVFKIDINAVI